MRLMRLSVACVVAMSAACAGGQTFRGLGVPPGAASSFASDVSALGLVVSGTVGTATGAVAFRWTKFEGFTPLPPSGGRTESQGSAVSGDGKMIVGTESCSGCGAADSTIGFQWTVDGGKQILAALPGHGYSDAVAASYDGSVIAGTGRTQGNLANDRALYWAGGAFHELPPLSEHNASAFDISADGSVIVGSARVMDQNGPVLLPDRAAFWQGGVLHDLGLPAGSQRAFIVAVSPDASTMVGNMEPIGADGDRSFVWTAAGGIVMLPAPADAHHHWMRDIAGDNQSMVGAVSPPFADQYACLSTPALGTVDLNVYLPTLGIDLSGWHLADANAISADGTVIVGVGVHNGVDEAFLVDLGADTDGDGLKDDWEINGVPYLEASGVLRRFLLDVDGDGESDADPMHKDLFVELDVMQGQSMPQNSINKVQAAFAEAPLTNPDNVSGVTLHTLQDEMDLPLMADWALASPGCLPVGFDALEQARFGTVSERSDPNGAKILEAKRLAFRHGIVAERSSPRVGGCAYVGGDTFVIWTALARGTFRDDDCASKYMHELGHNLGLQHGGGDEINGKPNYPSIMNYVYSYRSFWSGGFWRLDYSHAEAAMLPVIDENSIDETAGIGSPAGRYASWYAPYGYDIDAPEGIIRFVGFARMNGEPSDFGSMGQGTVFFRDGVLSPDAQQDLNFLVVSSGGVNLPNRESFGEVLRPYDDWGHIRLATKAATASAAAALVPVDELTMDARDAIDATFPLPPCDPDLNQDGNVDQTDIAYLVDVIAGGPNGTGIDPDFNHDGNADQGDIDSLIDVVAGGNCP